jgi:hypothetical protein
MSVQTGFRLFIFPLIFSTLGVTIALLLDNASGIYAFLVGCIGGLLLAELLKSPTLREWERMGLPGDPKTPKQQKVSEQGQNQGRRFLIVVFGLIGAALLRTILKENMILVAPAGCGAAAILILRLGWLVYQKRGKLGP